MIAIARLPAQGSSNSDYERALEAAAMPRLLSARTFVFEELLAVYRGVVGDTAPSSPRAGGPN